MWLTGIKYCKWYVLIFGEVVLLFLFNWLCFNNYFDVCLFMLIHVIWMVQRKANFYCISTYCNFKNICVHLLLQMFDFCESAITAILNVMKTASKYQNSISTLSHFPQKTSKSSLLSSDMVVVAMRKKYMFKKLQTGKLNYFHINFSNLKMVAPVIIRLKMECRILRFIETLLIKLVKEWVR